MALVDAFCAWFPSVTYFHFISSTNSSYCIMNTSYSVLLQYIADIVVIR
uniref:Uncharacterized protein n=1 Tax=Arundo donax TaxID=35708 RepID=A0A0A9EDH4_ARUDO